MTQLAVLRSTPWALVFVTFALIGHVSSCMSRSGNGDPPAAKPPLVEAENPLVLDKDTVSIVEQTLVKTLISMGKLKFHCPRENGLYPDKLDCTKYYNCTTGNFTTGQCDVGKGFDPSLKLCAKNETVSLCQRVSKLDDFACNSTGLHTLEGQCEKFVICTGDAAFSSNCNRGDLFDQKLKLCLPEKEAFCETKVEDVPVKNI